MEKPKMKKKADLFPYLMLIPALGLLFIITIYPFVTSLTLSLFDYSFLKQGMNFVGLKNYIDIITEGVFLSSVWFTLFWTAANVLFMTVLSLAAALMMRQSFLGQGFIKAVLLVPWILPQVVTGYTFSLMLSEDIGIINTFLRALGLIGPDFSWFATPGLATAAVLMANIWRGFPFITLMIYAKMQSIPTAYLEAAKIDGANGPQRFWHIMLPYIRPVLGTCMMLTFVWSFNAFDIIKVMTGGGPLNATTTLALRLQKEAFEFMEISRASTMAVIMFCVLLVCVGVAMLVRTGMRRMAQRAEARK